MYIMQIYIYTNPQCQAAEVSQLPERGNVKNYLNHVYGMLMPRARLWFSGFLI